MNGDSMAQTCWRDEIRERFRHASLATSDLTVGPSVSARSRRQERPERSDAKVKNREEGARLGLALQGTAVVGSNTYFCARMPCFGAFCAARLAFGRRGPARLRAVLPTGLGAGAGHGDSRSGDCPVGLGVPGLVGEWGLTPFPSSDRPQPPLRSGNPALDMAEFLGGWLEGGARQ